MPKPKTTPRKPAPKKPAPPPVDLNEVAKLVAANAKAIAELRASNAEHRTSNAELRQFIADLGVRIAENHQSILEHRASNAELRQFIADIGERADKALAVAEKNNRYIGAHANGEGEILEIECKAALRKMGKLNGVKLDDLSLGMNSDKFGGVEIDLVGINGKVTFPMEVKRTLLPEDVRRFRDVQVKRFKKAFPYLVLGKQVTPVVIFALRKKVKNPADGKKEDPVQLALKAGMIVLQSTGENQLTPITTPAQVTTRSPKDKD